MLPPGVFRPSLILGALFLASCVPAPAPPPAAPPRAEIAVPPPPAAKRDITPPTTPVAQPRLVQVSLSGISIAAVAFDSRSHRLVVADQPGGPGSLWPDAKAAADSRGGIAAVNGGFFTPEGKPLGLVFAGGKRSGSLNRASSLGAGLFVDDGAPALVRRDTGKSGAELLQTGPFLVENGSAVTGLSPESSTARTFLGWDGKSGWFIARSGTCSLSGLAQALEGQSLGGISAHHVLNLDGGRSSDLWAGQDVSGGSLQQRPFWNKPVRNFLVIVPR